MRIEAKDTYPGEYQVFVDGKDVTADCCAFDADAGYAECYVRDVQNPTSFKLTPVRNSAERVTLRGVVTFTKKDPDHARRNQ